MDNASWSGRVVITQENPERLAPPSEGRQAWRAFALNEDAQTGRIGYSSRTDQAYIPMPSDAGYPVGSAVMDGPCETNEIWYHGPIGSEVGYGECAG